MSETRKIAAILVADVVGTAGSRERTRIGRSRVFGDYAAISSILPSRPITAVSSSGPVMGVSLSFAVWSTPCAARSKFRMA